MTKGYPIQPFYEIFYIHSMLFNSASAVQSLMYLSEPLAELAKNRQQPPDDFDDDDVLNHLQNVVLQAGAVSKYCFPPRKGHEARAETIKLALGVSDSSPLANRDLRNAMEHFDERLDEYLSQGVFGHFFPQYVGPEPEPNQVPSHIFRAFYVDNDTFELLGIRYSFNPIATEILRVHKEIRRCFEEGGRLHPRK